MIGYYRDEKIIQRMNAGKPIEFKSSKVDIISSYHKIDLLQGKQEPFYFKMPVKRLSSSFFITISANSI